jgi:hypothetical protein
VQRSKQRVEQMAELRSAFRHPLPALFGIDSFPPSSSAKADDPVAKRLQVTRETKRHAVNAYTNGSWPDSFQPSTFLIPPGF